MTVPLIMPYEGVSPTIDETVFIAPNAVVIGDTHIGARSSVWFNCVLRGDVNKIRIGAETNIQDGTVIHVDSRNYPTIIGDRVTIGHMALVHACTVGDDCLIGMKACVMDGAVVENGAIVAAGALVTPGKVVPSGQLWAGSPARYVRDLKDDERKWLAHSASHYASLAEKYL